MQKVLITGITGFVGSHLADYLLSLGNMQIWGTIRHRSKLDNILHIQDKIKLRDCNVVDAISVMQIIKEIKPDVIHHLAAQSFVPTSWKAPQETLNTNIISTVNILEAVREYCKDCVVHIVGSSEEYGLVYKDELPITEGNTLRPLSPYGVSKVTQDLLAQQYCRSYGLRTRISRAFNHEGPRRGEVFVTSDFARQIIDIERGVKDTIKVGNLEAIRDFTDVRDVVKAYWLLVNKGENGIPYNIASGEGISIKELLSMFIKFSNIVDKVNLNIEGDINKMRPSDVPVLIGDSWLIHQLGWCPEITLEQTVKDILDYWRNKK